MFFRRFHEGSRDRMFAGVFYLKIWTPDKPNVDQANCKCDCFDTVFRGAEYVVVTFFSHLSSKQCNVSMLHIKCNEIDARIWSFQVGTNIRPVPTNTSTSMLRAIPFKSGLWSCWELLGCTSAAKGAFICGGQKGIDFGLSFPCHLLQCSWTWIVVVIKSKRKIMQC